jgi:2',3'-cyclic-nucleotide 2'-phosphodiesterase
MKLYYILRRQLPLMQRQNKKWLYPLAAGALSLSLIVGTVSNVPSAKAAADPTVDLRILETTDIHVGLMNYDYYQDKPTDEYGLVRTATLINQARAEKTNTMLFDNGDLIQGNPLGDYMARVDGMKKEGEVHPVYKAMNLLQYDVATIGNHEFNYGLDYLKTALKGSNFPYVNANIYIDDHDNNPNNDKNYFTPYIILDKKVKDSNGVEQTLKVGVIGFVTPQVMAWDKGYLDGKVISKDIVETAKKFVPEMKAKGADIVVALNHSGMGTAQLGNMDENTTWELTKSVPGIDAVLFGHSHVVFPAASFKDMPGIDLAKGTINGVAGVQAGFWGNNLGIIDLTLTQTGGKWTVSNSHTEARPISEKKDGKTVALVESDPKIVDAVKAEHDATLSYIRGPVGKTTASINSYFALVADDPSIQLVTNAQKWYVQQKVKGTAQDGLPILSAGAPFKAGGGAGPSYYTDIPAGTIAIKNVSDLYIYPNTLKAVLLNGDQVREWLERAAGQFNQIDPNKSEEQPLINNTFPTYNYDVIDGVSYQIDVTQASRYNGKGEVIAPDAHRIINLKYQGKPVTKDMKFVVVTNNYRASGGGFFPGLDGKSIVLDSPDENRQVVIDYITTNKTINPSADNNWAFAPIQGNVNVTFETSPNAQDAAKKMNGIQFLSVQPSGFAKYSIDMKNIAAPSELPVTPEKPPVSFSDVPATHWAFSAINDLAAKQIVTGKSDTIFDPNTNVSRAEFATLLVKALKLTAKNKSTFSDVPATAWYADAVAAANENGLVNGVAPGLFAPNDTITREQMAVMASSALKLKAGKAIIATSDIKFTDDSGISAWAKAGVTVTVDRGVMSGRGAGKFVPKASTTRAEAAKAVHTLITNISVQLLGINDFHGQLDYKKDAKDAAGKVISTLGGADYLAAYLKQREATNPNTLLVHAGDAVGASAPVSALLQDEPTIDFLNRLGFDIGTFGNHEFDQGATEALRLINGGKNPKTGKEFAGANFPYVLANVVDANGKPLLDAYKVLEVGGVKIGFIGVVTKITPTIVKAESIKGLTFTDQTLAVNKAVKELKAQGVETIVILAHDPYDGKSDAPTGEVVNLANSVDDAVDVIFAGHNHGGLNKMIDGKLVVEAYSYGTALADVDLEIDRATQNVVIAKAEVVDIKHEGITPDAEITQMVKDYQEKNAPIMNAPVGKADADITRTPNSTGESALGNLIADGMRDAMKTDFAFMNSGGIRNDLLAGNVTYGNVFSIQPFGNVLIKMTLTGAQMKELLNQQWGATGTKIGQISGFTYKYDTSKPAGQKIIEIKKADGTALDDAASYTIVVNDFMATGGDGYSVLIKGTNREAGPVDLDTTIAYIKSKFASTSITAKVEGRFTKVN